MCDGFNFVTFRSHAICTYNVANALFLFFAKMTLGFDQL